MYFELFEAIKKTINNFEKAMELLGSVKKDLLGYSGWFAAGAFTEQKNNTSTNKVVLEFNENLAINNLDTKLNQEEQVIMKYKGVSIFKRKDCASYYARYRQNGKQHYITHKTKKGCYELLKRALDNREEVRSRKYSTTLFEEWYKIWLESFKTEVRESTLANYNYMYKNLPQQFVVSEMINITALQVMKILNSIEATRQRQKVYEWLKDIFTKAYLYKVTKENIFDVIEKPKHISKQTIALSQEQEAIFIEKCRGTKYGLFYLICLMQGLRRGECMALTPDDFDFEARTLTINKSINEHSEQTNTKTISSNRVMPLFDRTINELKAFNFGAKNQRIFNVSTKPLFEHFKAILKNAELPNIKIHELRHTFITRMQELNIPEFVVQSWVGHELGSKVTKKVYTHINLQDLLLYNNKVNKKLK